MQLINVENWVPVLYGLLVQGPTIYAHPKCLILLLHQNHRRSKGSGTWSNETQLKEFFDGILNIILEFLWMLSGVYFYGKCSNFQLNYVLNATASLPAMWEVFKKTLMLMKHIFYVFGLVGNID